MKMKVVIWNENYHEKIQPIVTENYPGGIHEYLKSVLACDEVEVTTATLDDPECGLTDELLDETDVLIWWGHMRHHMVPDQVVARVYRHVLAGMGIIILHSGHYSKIFKKLMGTSGTLKWRSQDRERIWCIKPNHPIAAGVDETFVLDPEEMYGERFDIPDPEEIIFLGWFKGGEVFRSGCTWTRGLGKVFYFQPGHESNTAYRNENVQKILKNAVRWACPEKKNVHIDCVEVDPLEN